MAHPAPPTTRQIAVACHCSPAAVSHALRNSSKVSQATRTRVQEMARSMGWRPNPMASAYMAHFRSARPAAFQASLAFMISNPQSGRLCDQLMYIQRHYAGAKQRAVALGYELETIWLHEPHLTAKRLNSILTSRNMPGIIVPGLVDPATIFDGVAWHQFASVAMGSSPSKSQIYRVTADTVAGFALVLRKARELGYRRIALVVSDAYDELVNHGTYNAACYLREQWSRDGSGCELLVHHFKTSGSDERDGIARWLEANHPDAVLGEEITWRTICAMGWKVPHDVAFMSVDWSPEYPLIGGFNQRHELHGSVAVETVVSQINQNERGLPAVPRTILIPGAWEDGLSMPPRADIPGLNTTANPSV